MMILLERDICETFPKNGSLYLTLSERKINLKYKSRIYFRYTYRKDALWVPDRIFL